MDQTAMSDELSQSQDLKQEIERSEGTNSWDSAENEESSETHLGDDEPSVSTTDEAPLESDDELGQEQEKTPHENAGDRRVLKFSEYFTRVQ